jgi:hypothetical protein
MTRLFLACCVALNVLAVAGRAAEQMPAPAAPEQPVAFSHAQHAGELAMPCAVCHINPDPGQAMTLPATDTCLTCHATVKADSPEVRKLVELAASERGVRWVRIYEIPTYVYFSHREHMAAGSACSDCHGPVAERAQLSREGDISMAGCMNCHMAKGASLDCGYCHQPYGP